MLQVVKCQSCNGDFDGQRKVPMVLPCQHNICYTCVNEYFQRNLSIKCFDQSCQQTHKLRPYQLPEDTQLLKCLEQKGIQSSITLFEGYQTKIRLAHTMLSEQQSSFLQQLINNLNQYVFKNSLVKQRDLKQLARQLSQQLGYLKYQQLQISKQGNVQQATQESSIHPRVEQLVSKLAKEAQETFQQISQVSVNVFEERDRMKVQMDTLSQVNGSYLTQVQQLSQQVSSIQQERAQIVNELVVTKDALRKLNQVCVDNDRKIAQMGQQLQDLQSQKMGVERQVQDLLNEKQVLATQYHQCQQQLSEVKQQNIMKSVTPQELQKVKPQQASQSQLAKVTNKEIEISIVSPNNKSVKLVVKQNTTIEQLYYMIEKQTKL